MYTMNFLNSQGTFGQFLMLGKKSEESHEKSEKKKRWEGMKAKVNDGGKNYSRVNFSSSHWFSRLFLVFLRPTPFVRSLPSMKRALSLPRSSGEARRAPSRVFRPERLLSRYSRHLLAPIAYHKGSLEGGSAD